MKRSLAMLLVLLSCAFVSSAQRHFQRKDNSCIIYGPDVTFKLMPPRGWSQDSTPKLMHGERTVFFPMGQKWQNAAAVIYISTPSYEGNLSEFIKKDLFSYRKTKEDIDISKGKSIKMDNGGKAEVREVLGDDYGYYEAIAYIQEEKAVVMIILYAKGEGRYNSNYERFEKVVKSYTVVN